ncbi:hypothetical protein PsAD2_03418 [Pseudovibrio axinellae]|uniref:Uncharacterized protein n=1 Tax=Pseudovibrio axinellae TaxID=989403 RepID=A0A165WJC6_9HYPH|nr:DUF6445 family protein [Pseudovibrio axinellae]KZL16599.1 hypothetical protein PsAD2_03418 [Pseudovibrio axinellae]SER91377.1 hypothetical protein SAMN05421798_1593 [Pseudovibrio axinellae]
MMSLASQRVSEDEGTRLSAPASNSDCPFSLNLFNTKDETQATYFDIDGEPLIVFDDFYADPAAIRKLALELNYDLSHSNRQYKNYPGERALISVSARNAEKRLVDAITKHLPRYSFIKNYIKRPVVFTKINISQIDKSNQKQKIPHIDDDCVLVAVCYLEHDSQDVGGGTFFYRHRETGLCHIPTLPDANISKKMRDCGYNPTKDGEYQRFISKEVLNVDGVISGTGIDHDTDIWKVEMKVGYRFNRCVVFSSRLLHSPVFDCRSNSISKNRLTQNFFFQPA